MSKSPEMFRMQRLHSGSHHVTLSTIVNVPSTVKSGSSSSHSSGTSNHYLGCLGHSTEQLQYSWIFPGDAPPCEYYHKCNESYSASIGTTTGSSNTTGSSSSGSWWGNMFNGVTGGSSVSYSYTDTNTSGYTHYEAASNSTESLSDYSNNTAESSSTESTEQVYGAGDSNNDEQGGGNDEEADGGQDEEYQDAQNQDRDSDAADDGSNSQYNETVEEGSTGVDSNKVVTNEDFPDVNETDWYSATDEDGNGDQSQENGNQDQNDSQQSEELTYDPYSDFAIQNCNTYENLWMWDLSLTCESEESLENCQCLFAEQLMEVGALSCEAVTDCPANCPICTTCMQLLGCAVGDTVNTHSSRLSNTYIYVIGAASGFIVLAVAYFALNRRRKQQTDLEAHLISSGQSDHARHHEADRVIFGSIFDYDEDKVWLSPSTPPARSGPSHRAAIESLGESSDLTDSNAGTSSISTEIALQEEVPEQVVWLAPVT